MISLSSAVNVVIQLLIAGCVFALLNWLIDAAPIDGKFKQIGKFILVVLVVLVLIGLLVSFGGGTPLFRQ